MSKSTTSVKQILANIANAQKSTGPKTEEGKNKVKLNGQRHGLTGAATIMCDEDRTQHDEFCKFLIDSMKPVTPLERSFAKLIAQGHYRLHRLHAIEENTFSWGHFSKPGDFEAEHEQVHNAFTHSRVFEMRGDVFRNLGLYEQRIAREMHKNMKVLKELQDQRIAEEARRKAEEANQKAPKSKAASANGFAFSADEPTLDTQLSATPSESPTPPHIDRKAA